MYTRTIDRQSDVVVSGNYSNRSILRNPLEFNLVMTSLKFNNQQEQERLQQQIK